MADEPSSESNTTDSAGNASPEALKPQEDGTAGASTEDSKDGDKSAGTAKLSEQLVLHRRASYRPSHKATFIGLASVALILAVNGAVIFFLFKTQTKKEGETTQAQVTVNQAALDKLGVNRDSVGNAGVELTINPDAKFKGKVNIGGDVSLGGQLKLSNKLVAGDANITKLEAGETAVTKLNINGDATATTMNLRNDLQVTGTSRMQGDVIINRLLTVNNSANISGNVAIGGVLTVNRFQATNLVSDTTLTVGGHIITRGQNPSFTPGNAMGTGGTASNSGNDASGTIFAGVGVGATAGLIGTVNFRQAYTGTPRVVVTGAVVSGGGAVRNVYVSRTATGFSVFIADPLQPGSYAFDYIIMQ